jgi:hypothetical protein
MARTKKVTATSIIEELEVLTKDREQQPLITSISHSPNGTIIGIDKEGKLWRYNEWLKKWEDRT